MAPPAPLQAETLLPAEHRQVLARLHFLLALVDCTLDLARATASPIAAHKAHSPGTDLASATASPIAAHKAHSPCTDLAWATASPIAAHEAHSAGADLVRAAASPCRHKAHSPLWWIIT